MVVSPPHSPVKKNVVSITPAVDDGAASSLDKRPAAVIIIDQGKMPEAAATPETEPQVPNR